jgi:hypothetical protein
LTLECGFIFWNSTSSVNYSGPFIVVQNRSVSIAFVNIIAISSRFSGPASRSVNFILEVLSIVKSELRGSYNYESLSITSK